MKTNFKRKHRIYCRPLSKQMSKNLRELNYYGQQLPIVKDSHSEKVVFDIADLDSNYENWRGFNTVNLYKGNTNPFFIKVRTEEITRLGHAVRKTHHYYLQ